MDKIIWGIFLCLTGFLLSFFLAQPKVQLAGDIVEYYGMSESLLSHASVELTSNDQNTLEKILHPAYFQDPGYYIPGVDDKRYPVHFMFYSMLISPIRLALRFMGENELKALSITNLLIVVAVVAYIFRLFVQNTFSRVTLLILLLLSPLCFFFSWPGPDAYYFILLLLSLYLFSERNYISASIIAALASWHSQPLLLIATSFVGMYIWTNFTRNKITHPTNVCKTWLISIIPLFLIMIPYIYNYITFGVLTPWTILTNAWTQANGFGLQNASLKKLYEQFFDLNMGLFWYAPVIMLAGIYYLIRSIKTDKRSVFLLIIFLVTALFYQTNPAWHFGTAGYGPSRHVIFALPFFIFFIVLYLRPKPVHYLLLSSIIISQVGILILNGGLLPNFENTLSNSPYAAYVLDRYPELYNPTPEIFVDRTNHTDNGYLENAIYKNSTGCKKAFLVQDTSQLLQACGYIPFPYRTSIVNNTNGIYINY